MQRAMGGDQRVTKAGGQVTNQFVPFRDGLEQWEAHGGKHQLSSLSTPTKIPNTCTIPVFKEKSFHQQF